MANKKIITGIDGLRTLGVLAVIFYHLSPGILAGGYLGVLIFFVLTGFLITDSLIREREAFGKVNWRHFVVKRLKRLYPLLIFVFFVSALYFFFWQPKLLTGMRESFLSSVLSVNNWWQIWNGSSYFQNFAITANNAFKHIYFLSIEGQFYIVILLIMPLFLRLKKVISGLLTVILSVGSAALMGVLFLPSDPTRVYYGTDTRIFALFIGMTLAFFWRREKKKEQLHTVNRIFSLPLAVLLLVGLFGALFLLPDKSQIAYYGGMFAFCVIVALLLLLISHPGLPVNRLFSNPIFSYIGSRSYGIYLWQLPLFVSLENLGVNTALWYNILWEFAIILVLTELSYRFVEKPFWVSSWQGFKKFFTQNLVSLRKIPFYALLPLTLAGLIIIFSAPAQARDIETLQKHLSQSQKTTQAHNKALEEAESREAAAKPSSSSSSKVASSSSAPAPPPPAPIPGLSAAVTAKAATMPVAAVGDSVMLDVAGRMQTIFPQMYIDGLVGRQANQGAATFRGMPASVVANAKVLLIDLGINGSIEPSDIASVMQVANGRPVYWVNVRVPRVWQDGDNAALAKAAKQYPNLHIIDWYSVSAGHPEYFVSDQVHLTTAGITAYSNMVANAVVGS
ncbi:MAG: acetyltransferase [Streptococcaceae bacterium]|jgi:peptidoglycan/LPS O-acetylase OafA/YrhL|nr:acetyltransferase [Streptococcaceae bacterium]